MARKEDLLDQWIKKRDSDPACKGEDDVGTCLLDPAHAPSMPNRTPESLPIKRPDPMLLGKLSDYLSKQKPRSDASKKPKLTTPDAPYEVDGTHAKALMALALVFTSHVMRFSRSPFSEPQLNQLRDQLLQALDPGDQVQIEGEAYQLIKWFATAMNPRWKDTVATPQKLGRSETSQAALLQIIQSAIKDHRDLYMHYYTGSRGDFSERRITPIEVTAEKFLIAYCHLRQEERCFRLTRIVELAPLASDAECAALLSYPNPADKKGNEPPKKKKQKPPKPLPSEPPCSLDETAIPTGADAPKKRPKAQQMMIPGFGDKK